MHNKNHSKKLVTLLAAGAGVALIASGCSGVTDTSGGDSASPSTLNFWVPPLAADDESDVDMWGEIFSPFEDENDVEIKVSVVPWDGYPEKMLAGVSSGDGPDVAYMYYKMLGDYIQKDQLIPFDDYLTDDYKAKSYYLDTGKFDGSQFGVPFVAGGARILAYNPEVLDDAGVETPSEDWDWEDFKGALKEIKDAGYTPFLQEWGLSETSALNTLFVPYLWQNGGEMFSSDGEETAFDTPEGVEAAEFVHSLLEDGLIPEASTSMNDEQALDRFVDGSVGFYVVNDALIPDDMEVGYITSLTEEQAATYMAIDALTMTTSCEPYKQLCADLVTFITSGDAMQRFHESVSYQPVGSDERATDNGRFQDAYSQPEIMHSDPIVPQSLEVYDVLVENLQQMMLGQKTADEALEDAASVGDGILAR